MIRFSLLVVSSCMNTMRLIEWLFGIKCSLRELSGFELISVKLDYGNVSHAYHMWQKQFQCSRVWPTMGAGPYIESILEKLLMGLATPSINVKAPSATSSGCSQTFIVLGTRHDPVLEFYSYSYRMWYVMWFLLLSIVIHLFYSCNWND